MSAPTSPASGVLVAALDSTADVPHSRVDDYLSHSDWDFEAEADHISIDGWRACVHKHYI